MNKTVTFLIALLFAGGLTACGQADTGVTPPPPPVTTTTDGDPLPPIQCHGQYVCPE